MSRELKRQLKLMKHEAVKPSAEWVVKSRSLLLSQIKNTVPKKVSVPVSARLEAAFSILMPERLMVGAVRFVAITMIVALVAPSLYYGTVMASEGSLPGENLYAAKRYAEKIQMAVVGLVGSTESETKLHVELAKRRADETSKIINDPSKISNVASTVADLKSEMTTVSDSLDQSNKNSKDISADVASDIKKNTDHIKDVLQSAKNDLIVVSPSDDKALNEVRSTKDLVQDVSVKAVEAMVVKHLEGDNSVTKEQVKDAINSTAQNVVGDMAESKENIAGMQGLLKNAKSDVGNLTNNLKDHSISSTTQEINSKIANAYDQANQAVQITDTINSATVNIAHEVNKLVGSDNFTQAMDRVKDMTKASKDVENISDKTIEQTQPFIPIVQVVKDVMNSGVTSSITIVSSSLSMLTTTPIVVTSTISTSSLTSTYYYKDKDDLRVLTTTVKIPTSTATSTKTSTSTR